MKIKSIVIYLSIIVVAIVLYTMSVSAHISYESANEYASDNGKSLSSSDGCIRVIRTGETLMHVHFLNSLDGDNEGVEYEFDIKPLKGVEYELFAVTECWSRGGFYSPGESVIVGKTDINGVVEFENLSNGIYRIVENTNQSNNITVEDSYVEVLGESTVVIHDESMFKKVDITYNTDTGAKLETGSSIWLCVKEDCYLDNGVLIIPKGYLVSRKLYQGENDIIFEDCIEGYDYYFKVED